MFLVSVINLMLGGFYYRMYLGALRRYSTPTVEEKAQQSIGIRTAIRIVVYGYLLLAVFCLTIAIKNLFLLALNLPIF